MSVCQNYFISVLAKVFETKYTAFTTFKRCASWRNNVNHLLTGCSDDKFNKGKIGISKLSFTSVSSLVHVQNFSYSNEFDSPENKTFGRTHTHINGFAQKTHFDTDQAKGNLEMTYYNFTMDLLISSVSLLQLGKK